MTTTQPRIITRNLHSDGATTFAVVDVPATASAYRLLIHDRPGACVIALTNFGTSAEFGEPPTDPSMAHSVAEHLTHGNLVDARNLVDVIALIVEERDEARLAREAECFGWTEAELMEAAVEEASSGRWGQRRDVEDPNR